MRYFLRLFSITTGRRQRCSTFLSARRRKDLPQDFLISRQMAIRNYCLCRKGQLEEWPSTLWAMMPMLRNGLWIPANSVPERVATGRHLHTGRGGLAAFPAALVSFVQQPQHDAVTGRSRKQPLHGCGHAAASSGWYRPMVRREHNAQRAWKPNCFGG